MPGRPFEPCEGARLIEEALASPGELLGMIRRARQHRRAALAQRQRRRQIFLDGDVAMERGIARAIGDAEGALAEDGCQLVAAQHGARRQYAVQLHLCVLAWAPPWLAIVV